MARRLSLLERAEAVLHAAVHGDEAACARYDVTDRTLRNYRDQVRDPETKLSASFRRLVAAAKEAQGDDLEAADERGGSFRQWLEGRLRETSDVLLEKAREINPKQPQAIEAVSGHFRDLAGHAAALEFLERSFPSSSDGSGGSQSDEGSP